MKFLKCLLLLVVYFLSYWIGVLMYMGALLLIWGQKIDGDFNAFVFWSAFAYIPIGIIYFILCAVVKRKVYRPALRYSLYPILCGMMFSIPTMLIIFMLGGGLRQTASPEAQLFYIMFISTGVAFGMGYGTVAKVWERYEGVRNA